MADRADKVMVLGIDAPIVPRLYELAKEGVLPTLGKLIAEGVFAKNSFGHYPTITPPNWTSLATGALPGTHGLTDFNGHVPGEPLDKVHQNYDARFGLAESIWQAAERVGKRSILINYPSSWKAELKDGLMVGGFGNHMNQWHYGVPWSERNRASLTLDILLSTEPYPFCSEAVFRKAQGWEGVEHSPRAQEAEVTLSHRRSLYKVAPITWQVLIDASEGRGYDTVVVAKGKRKQDVYARLKVGEWSPNVYDTFETDAGPKRAVFRMKVMELSPDGTAFRLYVPGICSLEDWASPRSLEQEIVSAEGLPLGRSPWEAWIMEWIDIPTMVQAVEFHNIFLADAATYLLKNKPWDVFYMHMHTPDIMYHTFSVELDPLTSHDEGLRAKLAEAEVQLYQSVDRCYGKILEAAANDKTLVAVVSDHGAKATMHHFSVNDVLEQAGLLAYKTVEGGAKVVDWTKTKAIGQREVYVYVNTKGRDPEGIVAQGEEYAQVQDQVVKALHEYVDPKTGLKPYILALKKEDARIIGLYGDRVGDIVYAVDPRYGEQHGPHLPTAKAGVGDLSTLFILNGPGVRKGEVIERMVRTTDLVPTLCHLAELPVPAQCEGSIIYQALEDPDAQVKELQALRRNVDRLKRMVERPPMC